MSNWVIVIDSEFTGKTADTVVGPFDSNALACNYAEVSRFKKGTYRVLGVHEPSEVLLNIAKSWTEETV